METRSAQESDLEPLSKIFSKSFTEAEPGKPWTENSALDLLSFYYTHQPDLFIVATDKDSCVGAIAHLIKPWRSGNRCVEGVLFVDSDYQKQGIGRMLFIVTLETAVKKYDAKFVEGITFAGKDFPRDWYGRIGFVQDEGAVLIKGDCREMLKNLRLKNEFKES